MSVERKIEGLYVPGGDYDYFKMGGCMLNMLFTQHAYILPNLANSVSFAYIANRDDDTYQS